MMLQKLLFNGNVHCDLLSSAAMVLILKVKLSGKHLPYVLKKAGKRQFVIMKPLLQRPYFVI